MKLSIPLPAKPKARPRFNGHAYMPADYRAWIDAFKEHARAALEGIVPLAAAVQISITFNQPKKPRCDLDNAVGACFDGLNKLAWNDDRQVIKLDAKWKPCEHTRIDIEVEDACP